MNRNRLAIRLALIAVVVVIFIVRRDRMSSDFAKGFIFALAFAVIVTIARAVMESKKRKQLEKDQQAASEGKKVELFSKPKDS